MSKRKKPEFFHDIAGHWFYVAQRRADGTVFRSVDVTDFVQERVDEATKRIVEGNANLREGFVRRGSKIEELEQQVKALQGDLAAQRQTCGELQAINAELKQRATGSEDLLLRLNYAIREAFDMGIEDGAVIVHRAWMQERSAHGFHRPKWWHLFCGKCHACMVPYEELGKERKDIDRRVYSAVRGALKMALENLRLSGGS